MYNPDNDFMYAINYGIILCFLGKSKPYRYKTHTRAFFLHINVAVAIFINHIAAIAGGKTVVYDLSSGTNCRNDAHNHVGDNLEEGKRHK